MSQVDAPRLCVVTPTPLLVIEIEPVAEETAPPRAEIHVHPGGQGLWVASMAASLGARPTVCGPFGGETGPLLVGLLEESGIAVAPITYSRGNGALIYDGRGQERDLLALMRARRLTRHEVDDLYGRALVAALDSEVCVLTGSNPAKVLPPAFFGRLVRDVRSSGTPVVADLSGQQAVAAAEAGVEVLKISDEELVAAELATSTREADLRTAAAALLEHGVGTVVVSRAGDPSLLVTQHGASRVIPPQVTVLEPRGAGDSMTAGIAVALARGDGIEAALRLGTAAGALNVTRRGLGTGRRGPIERFAHQVRMEELT